MNLDNITWNNDTYNGFIDYLFSIKDETYSKFHFKLLKNDKIKVIGIRVPLLKEMAKKISKTNYSEFIKLNKHRYYEEILLHGLVITYLKINFINSIELFENYIKYINNWASCDTVVANYKSFKKNLDLGLTYINKYLNSKNPWIIRVGLVLLLEYYINDEYIDIVLKLANNVKNEDYYVKMANAWLISTCLIKYYDKTLNFLKSTKIDSWTYNKTLQKAIESYRIKDKNTFKMLKKN